jgi:hypothetical protein
VTGAAFLAGAAFLVTGAAFLAGAAFLRTAGVGMVPLVFRLAASLVCDVVEGNSFCGIFHPFGTFGCP